MPTTPRLGPQPLIHSDLVMERYGYPIAKRTAFWEFIRYNSIPYIRLGRRKKMFDPAVLAAYEASRTVGKVRS